MIGDFIGRPVTSGDIQEDDAKRNSQNHRLRSEHCTVEAECFPHQSLEAVSVHSAFDVAADRKAHQNLLLQLRMFVVSG